MATLPAGDVTDGVVRVGDTVRRPHQPQSLAVAGYLDHLERAGFDASPRYLGRDSRGRDVLTHLPGEVAGDPPRPWAAGEGLLASVAVLLRRLNEASAGYGATSGFAAPPGSAWARDLVTLDPPEFDPPPELISHVDVTPQNVVVRDGWAVGLIDFDLAGPTTRLLSAYNAAMHWVPLRAPEDLWPGWDRLDCSRRLRVFADAFELTPAERRDMIAVGVARGEFGWRSMRASATQLGGGWARMWDEGVGDLIRRRTAWLAENEAVLRRALE